MTRTPASTTAPVRLQATVALGAGFGLFAALPGVVITLGGVLDAQRSLWVSASVSLLAGVALCVLGAAHWRRAIPDRFVEWAPAGVAVILALQSAGHLLTTTDPAVTTFLLLSMVATGATVPRWWVLLIVDSILVAADVVALTGLDHSGPVGVAPVAALVISVLMGASLYAYHSAGRKRLHALTQEIALLATLDPLTGLLNRRGLPDRLLARDGQVSIVAVICLDLNGFKAINDELGHSAGDAILCTVAQRLSQLTRDQDHVARTGGDEFLIVTDLPDEQALISLRRGLTAQLTRTAGVLDLPWSVSVGSAWRPLTPHHDVTVEALMHEADVAMYDDKRRYHQDRRAGAAGPNT